MPNVQEPHLHLEIAHVLFMDVVGYSKLLVNEQREMMQQLNQLVRKTAQFQTSEANGKLISIPSGDGMALVFFQSLEEPVQCAMEISRLLKNYPRLRLRMGVHSGPVDQIKDVNDRLNVAGAGINFAQRMMDCGDAGHILVSKRVADDLAQDSLWQPHLHELGEIGVKHGVRVQVVNLYTEELGNPEVPEKFKTVAAAVSAATKARSKPAMPRDLKWLLIGPAVLIIAAIMIGRLVFRMVGTDRRAVRTSTQEGRPGGPSLPISEKSIAVLPFENLSEEKANAYFADGIQAEILTRLSK